MFAKLIIIGLCLLTTAFCAAEEEQALDPLLIQRLAASLSADHDNADRYDAEVWLRVTEPRLARYLDDREDRIRLLRLVFREASLQKLDADLVLAVMQIESRFDRFAVSSAGAQGLMQVMPFWRLEIGREQDNLTNPETNIRYGTTILAHYMDIASGDLVEALGRYNGSRGKLWYPELVLSAWRKDWRNKSWGELPQLRESCSNYPLRACLYQ